MSSIYIANIANWPQYDTHCLININIKAIIYKECTARAVTEINCAGKWHDCNELVTS